MKPELLPAFAALAGNDYTGRKDVAAGSTKPVQQQRGPNTELLDLIQWMRKTDPSAVFEEFLKNDLSTAEEKLQKIKTLREAADHYTLPPSSLKSFFDQDSLPELPLQMEDKVPDWIKRPVTDARFSSDFLDVLINQRVGLSVVVDHKDKSSANQVSFPLRRVLYSLLLGEGKEVEERDKDGLKVSFHRVTTKSTGLCLQSLPEANERQRKELLLRVLGIAEESLSLPPHLSHLELPLAATIFWLKETRPPHDLLKALLIGWCKQSPLRQNTDLKCSLDLDWCHMLNQWQSCLRDCFILNQLLDLPLLEPPMARLYNGTFIHDLLYKMKDGNTSVPSDISQDFDYLLQISEDGQTGSVDQATTAKTVSSDQQLAWPESGGKSPKPVCKGLETSNPNEMNPIKKSKIQ